jgi:glycosyltransferase involved in cell wall biosynthesis
VTFHLLTGEYPPERGGVGDYTALVARALAARGSAVHVWCPSAPASGVLDGIQLHTLPDRFGRRSRRELEAAFVFEPGCVLLQYVPNALGARGANLAFCGWLWRLGASGRADVRVMFHEPFFYFGRQSPARNALALVHRVMAALLLRAGRRTYLSTGAWTRYLEPWAPRGTQMTALAVPSTVPAADDPAAVHAWRRRFAADGAHVIGHFGTFGDHLGRELRAAIPAILRACDGARFVCIGRGSDGFVRALAASHPALAVRLVASGELDGPGIAAALRACDLVVQPYPDGVTTRRTSVMAPLANGVPTITTSGPLTEPIWSATDAVALVTAADADGLATTAAALLHDAAARTSLGRRGCDTYRRHFAIDLTVDTLLDPRATPASAAPPREGLTACEPEP